MDIEATLPPATVDARAARRIYRHRLPVRLMHWINVVCLTVLLMSGLNIFNAHPALYWGQRVDVRRAVDLVRRAQHAGRPGRLHAHRRPRVRHHRRPRPVDGSGRRADGARVSVVGDDPGRPVAGDGAPLALLLRLDLRHQRRRLPALHDLQQAPEARPRADARGAEEHRPLDRRPPQVQAPDRRGGDALQRAAEPDLPDRHLRPAAAGRVRRAGDVAAPRRRLHRLGRPPRRPAVGANAALPRRLRPVAVRRRPRRRGVHRRRLERDAIDDHRLVRGAARTTRRRRLQP